MKSRSRNIVIALALLALLTLNLPVSTAHAQGTAFTYQGRLNDGGAPANGSYDLRFILYDNSVGGSQQGPILTNSPTSVSNGLFTVTLDFSNQFSGTARWLEIAARTNGGGGFATLSPRQPLTPAPYAIAAENVVAGAGLSGTYGGAVTLNNAANQFTGSFTGNGATVTNVNAATLGGLGSSSFWQLGGNNVSTGQILGSTNNQPLELWANGQRGMRLEPTATDANHSNIVNVVNGSSANTVVPGVYGATIAGGGAGIYNSLRGGNAVTADYGTVGGGFSNVVRGTYSTVGGGALNTIQQLAADSVIAGGSGNTIAGNDDSGSTIGGGENNSNNLSSVIYVGCGTIAGGSGNRTDGGFATVGGGIANQATGGQATVPGGEQNIASGSDSFAAGSYAQATNHGTFVWSDDSQPGVAFTSTAPDQFLIRAAGGVGIGLANPTAALHVGSGGNFVMPQFQATQTTTNDSCRLRLNVSGHPFWEMDVNSDPTTPQLQFWISSASGPRMSIDNNGNVSATSFNPSSDRNLKENFSAVSPRAVLDKVVDLPITRWNFKEDKASEHLGPMAQDFHAAFGLGLDDKHIATVDEGGVALAAVQGLNEKLNEKDAEIQDLKQRLDALEKIVLKQKSN